MNERTKALWVPGLAILAASMALLGFLIRAGVRPLTFFTDWHHPLQFHIPWLVTLPFLGAVGVWWSRRVGGRRKTQLLAGIFPVIAMAGLALFALVGDLIVDVGGGRHSVWHTLCGFGYFIVCWIAAPGVALLLGVLAFFRFRPAQPSSDLPA